MMARADDALARLVREEGTGVLATLIRVTGQVELAQDAAQDAMVRALETWPRDGVPDNPRGWLLVTAKRRAVDIIRREARRAGKETEAMMFADPVPGPAEPPEVIRDDLLRLVFTCCHPALALEAQVALALRTLGGLSTAEVARSLLVPEPTMAKRLSRARQKIAQARIPYRVPDPDELPGRLAGVAATVYLIFNEGYAAGAGADLVRVTLTAEAIRLARLLAGLMPDEPTVLGLLALLLLTDARRAARVDPAGRPVLLADQDRSKWDADAIKEGVELVGRAAADPRPSRPVRGAGGHCRLPRFGPGLCRDQLGRGDLLVRRAARPGRVTRGPAQPGGGAGRTGRSRAGAGPGGRDRRTDRVPVVARDPGRAAAAAGPARRSPCGLRAGARPRHERAPGRASARPHVGTAAAVTGYPRAASR